MSQRKSFSYIFRKYPLFRGMLAALLLIAAVVAVIIFIRKSKILPIIEAIDPSTGESGELITLQGTGFGTMRSDSYVEIGGNRLISSAYSTWTDTCIQIVLPFSTNDGLVYVITPVGKSNPVVFTCRNTIPVPVRPDPETLLPSIQDTSVSQASIGSVITITGKHFGTLRNDSQVFFSAMTDKNTGTAFIHCSENESDYLFWSDQELQVRVPDGATTGTLFVRTAKGTSNSIDFTVTSPAGYKEYTDERVYILELNADIMNAISTEDSQITMYAPYPPTSSWQRVAELTSSSTAPLIEKYQNTVVYQIPVKNSLGQKTAVQTVFKIHVWNVSTVMTNRAAKQGTASRTYYQAYLAGDSIVPAEDEAIVDLAASIVKKETSPWYKANLIYSYVIDSVTLLRGLRPVSASVLDVLDTNEGDAYDMAVLFTALCRAAGIPAIPVSGILVDSNLQTTNHWWSEFYLDNVGWIPVDPAMGAGKTIDSYNLPEDPRAFYFANLDSQHIAFSRGYNSIKSALQSGKKVYRQKTFSLQSVWEEASASSISYSSYWSPVAVQGVY